MNELTMLPPGFRLDLYRGNPATLTVKLSGPLATALTAVVTASNGLPHPPRFQPTVTAVTEGWAVTFSAEQTDLLPPVSVLEIALDGVVRVLGDLRSRIAYRSAPTVVGTLSLTTYDSYTLNLTIGNASVVDNNLAGLTNLQQARDNLGLGLVNNTRDSDKPVSTPQRQSLLMFTEAQTLTVAQRRQGRENLGFKTLTVTAAAPGSQHTHNLNDSSVVCFLPSGAGLWEATPVGANSIVLNGPEGETFTGPILILASV